jgi:chemotaxis protein MotB
MAKNKRSKKGGEGGDDTPAWLVTFSDMMTLLLTFFVLLLSMATLTDERKKYLVLGSIQKTFGMGKQSMEVLSTQQGHLVEPGPMENVKDLSPLKNLVWEDQSKDLNFISNAFVQILTINADLLFAQGQSQLSPQGKQLLRNITPQIKNIAYPLLIAGYTSQLRDEFGLDYKENMQKADLDPSWKLSLQRALAVYRFFLDQEVDPAKLRVEAHGKYEPRFSTQTASGRKKNRRVELILDKRNYVRNPNLRSIFPKQQKQKDEKFQYNDFIFDLKEPQQGAGAQSES